MSLDRDQREFLALLEARMIDAPGCRVMAIVADVRPPVARLQMFGTCGSHDFRFFASHTLAVALERLDPDCPCCARQRPLIEAALAALNPAPARTVLQ